MENNFKYFVKIEKAFNEDGDFYVQGIASGTREDRDDQRMGVDVLKNFVDKINSSGLPLTDGHPKSGPIAGTIGTITYARINNDADHSLFIKAKLDKDHPNVPYLMKKVQEGKKFAFSIEGFLKKAVPVFSDRLNKVIREFKDIVPKSISITTEPSYIPSFLEVVTKAAKNYTEEVDKSEIFKEFQDSIKNLNLIIKTKTMNIVDKIEETTQNDDVKSEETTTQTETEKVEEVNSPSTDSEEVKSSTDSEVKKSIGETDEMIACILQCTSMLNKLASMLQQKDMIEDAMMDSTYDEEYKSKTEKDLVTKSELTNILNETLETFKASMENIAKSLHSDIEEVKKLPLQKKSLVKSLTIEKSFDDRKYTEIANDDDRFKAKYRDMING